ncbi:uncharacterized protein LOC129728251 [Wyeomyia smithii]|uniref:uncharacterized protein LOC129728251 n=1 Tax=Wyeomyia smithii TaxID=174621 RepID=UPI002467C1C2|nr:uncharacterized protein LOC129728251 [Wyeomyia smithii]
MGNKNDVSNYRGITSLCAVAKLLELVMSTDQHGFTAGRSIDTNLLCLNLYISDSMVKRAQTVVIYADLTAAFNKLNHRLAIAKLDNLGINGNLLLWFQSYLTVRRLTVAIRDCQSLRLEYRREVT